MTPSAPSLVWQQPQRLDRSCCPAALAAGSHASSAVPAEASCPGFCSTWPAGELGEAGQNVCRPRAPPGVVASLAASLPAYGSPGDTCRLPGVEIGRPGAGTHVGRGVALHVRRAGPALFPALPGATSIVPSRSQNFPQGLCAVHCTRVDLGFLCAEPTEGGPQVCPGGRQLSVGPAAPGCRATDQGLTGTRETGRQGVRRSCRGLRVPDTGPSEA